MNTKLIQRFMPIMRVITYLFK